MKNIKKIILKKLLYLRVQTKSLLDIKLLHFNETFKEILDRKLEIKDLRKIIDENEKTDLITK
tara:strand:+ start:245 stop:433 length:189 start_codon:yes stop_codon:yes gene_type:complete